MSLCPESEYREGLSDGEFWEYVFNRYDNHYTESDYYGHYPPDEDPPLDSPCSECGAYGACAYDQEGRPMIHAVKDDDEAS